jgi:hypothetical protein
MFGQKKEEKAKAVAPFALISTESQDLQNAADHDDLETEMRGLLSRYVVDALHCFLLAIDRC